MENFKQQCACQAQFSIQRKHRFKKTPLDVAAFFLLTWVAGDAAHTFSQLMLLGE